MASLRSSFKWKAALSSVVCVVKSVIRSLALSIYMLRVGFLIQTGKCNVTSRLWFDPFPHKQLLFAFKFVIDSFHVMCFGCPCVS